MIRATVISALLVLSAAAARAEGLEAWLASVAKAERDLNAACDSLRAAPPPEGLVWLRLGPKGVEIAPADPDAAAAAAFWAEAALGAKAAAEALYGQAAGAELKTRPVTVETGPAGVSIHDGETRRSGDVCDAMRGMVSALGGAGGSGDPFEDAREMSQSGLAVQIGGRNSAPLETPPPAGALVRGPDGVVASVAIGEDGARLNLSANRGAVVGDAEVRIYDPADPFRPVEVLPLKVLPGAAPDAPPPPPLVPGGAAQGTVGIGEIVRIPVNVAETGRVSFSSAPGADFAATLETEAGAPVASDDDSGDGYGFAFSADLQPGNYFLSLNHCCGGGGAYDVKADPR